MNIRNDEFEFYPATQSDNAEIDKLLRNPDFEGDLQLLYTRGTDPVASFENDGDKTLVLCGRHKKSGELAGFGVCNIKKMYIDGKIEDVAYLSGLRVHPDFRRKTLRLLDAYALTMEWISKNNVKYIITTILKDNEIFQKLVSKKRKNFPEYIRVADYRVWIIPSTIPFRKVVTDFNKIQKSEIDTLKAFYEENSRRWNLYPIMDFEKLNYKNFRVIKREGAIIASVYLEKRPDKVQVLHKYDGKYSYIKYVRHLLPLFGYPVLPKEGQELDYRYISYHLCIKGEEKLLADLVMDVAMEDSSINYAAIGCIMESKIDEILSNKLKMSYDSILYSVVGDDLAFAEKIRDSSNIYLELSSL